MARSLLKIIALAFMMSVINANQEAQKTITSHKPKISLEESPEDIQAGIKRNVRAGFIATFTQKFFNDYNALLMEFIVKKMRSMELVDICNEHILGQTFTANMCTVDTTLTQFDIDTKESNLQILHEEKALSFIVKGINLQFNYGFKIWSEPEWIQDEGTGMIKVKNADFMITLHPT